VRSQFCLNHSFFRNSSVGIHSPISTSLVLIHLCSQTTFVLPKTHSFDLTLLIMYNLILLALLGSSYLAVATCSDSCTFDQISPSTTLTWCTCYDDFLCARLDVSTPLPFIQPLMLNHVYRCRWTTIIRLAVELQFP
jgi:hypothetical protein